MILHNIIESSAKNPFIVFIFMFILTLGGLWGLKNIPLDAIPDLSDVQVIVFTEWPGRSPDIMEDQITYPIVTALLGAPKVKVVRGISMFGFSFVYVIFEDGTDMYWARSRVLEYMDEARSKLPGGVTPTLGPDATGVGWGFEYALVRDEEEIERLRKSVEDGKLAPEKFKKILDDLSPDKLRGFQDWYLKFWLKSVKGVSDVASVGGFVKQYQVTLNPGTLLQYKIPLQKVIQAIRKSNNEVGGRIVEFNGTEYIVRGRGYIKSTKDLYKVVVAHDMDGAPLLLEDIANISLGPEMRRGMTDLNGEGEVVGAIVVVRFGEDVLSVIERVKKKLKDLAERKSLPTGSKIVTTYDRSDLIMRAVETLKEKLIEESIIVSLVSIIFLFHFRSALVAILTLPLAIIISFMAMHFMGLSSNIMSLGGIAIAIGAMVDSAIVMVENAHKHLEHAPPGYNRKEVIIEAAKEVGRPLFFALLIITISFTPIFTLEGTEGKLFKPLAFTKTFAMFFASLISLTLVPILMVWLIKGKIMPEHKNPVNRFLIWAYQPIAHLTVHYRKTSMLIGLVIILVTIYPYLQLETEFMPPLDEGTLMFMPVTIPGMSIEQARKILQKQDKIIKEFPEVKWAFGKVGRADTATDPAPITMIETIVELKPKSEWREGYDLERLKNEMNKAVTIAGVSNSWTLPIKGRIDMLATGIRTNLGIKIFGDNLDKLQEVGLEMERKLKKIRGRTIDPKTGKLVSATRSIIADRIAKGGRYIDFDIKREAVARYGLNVEDVQDIIETAIGGKNIDTTIEGRERYPINVRYPRELRDSIEKLNRVLVLTPTGSQILLSDLADLKIVQGPAFLRSENGQLVEYVFVDVVESEKTVAKFVEEAEKLIKKEVHIPAGYTYMFSGTYESEVRYAKRIMIVAPLTLLMVIILLYFNLKSWPRIGIVLLAILLSLVGAFWLLHLLDYKLSAAVWVGIIALAGLDAEMGAVMLLYLDLAHDKWVKEGRMRSVKDLEEATLDGAVQRIRPKMMTVSAILFGLLPVMWSDQAGADVMKRIAAPMIGGVITSGVLSLLLYPSIYVWWRGRKEFKETESIEEG